MRVSGEFRYGWIRDVPDHRDKMLKLRLNGTLPDLIDMRPSCPPVYDQGNLGSCTANAIAGLVQYERRQRGMADFVPSRLFIYYGEREMEHTIGEDSGAMLRDGIKVVVRKGVCAEVLWPYDVGKFTRKPNKRAYKDAENGQVTNYRRIPQSLYDLKSCLADGQPFVFRFAVCESFESQEVAVTGTAPMPKEEEQVLGGHAVMAVGYDENTQRFLVRNSWSEAWGDKGYFTLPFSYLTNPGLAADFWTINAVEED
jgi:C1A family cysteine protease